MLSAQKPATPPKPTGSLWRMAAILLANIVAAGWIALCLSYAATTVGIPGLLHLPPTELGLFVLGTLSIPGMIWMWLGHRARLATLDRAGRALNRQFRDFVKFSAQEHGEVLSSSEASRRESLSLFEAAQASLAALGQVEGVLSQTTQKLIQATSTSSQQMDNAGKAMEQRVQAMRALADQLEAGDLQQSSGEVVAALELVLSRLQKAEAAWDQRTGQLDEIASSAVSRLNDSGEAVHNSVATAFDRLDRFTAQFEDQIGATGEIERAITASAATAQEALARIRAEQEAASREIEAFGERGHGLSLRLEGLRAAAVNGTSDLIGEADRLQSRSESLTDELKGQAIAFGDAISRADGVAAIVKTTGAMIEQTVTRASEASRVIRGEFEAVGHVMDTTSGALQQKAATATDMLTQTRARMEESIAQIGAILAGLDGKAGDINFTVSTSINRLGELTHGLERAREEVLGSTDRVASHIDGIGQTLRSSAEAMWQSAQLVTEASNHAIGASGQLEQTGDGLRDRVVEISRVAAEATETLRLSTDGLAHSADRTREQLGQIAHEVRQENEAIAGTLSRIANVEIALRGAGAIVEDIATKAEKAAEGARTEMHAMGREIALQSKVLADTSGSNGMILGRTREEMEGVVAKVQDAFGDLNQKASEINFVVSTAVNRLGELSRGLENAQVMIDGATDSASGKMAGAASAMRSEFDGVQDVANRALQRLEHTLADIAATSATVDSETQTIEQRLSATVRVAEAGGAVFAEKVTGAIDRYETAEQSLIEGQARLAQGAEDATAHFQRLARELAAGGGDLGTAAVVIGERIIGASAMVEQRLAAINAIADQVRSALGTFTSDLGGLGEQSDTVTRQLADRGEILRDNIVQLVRAAAESVEGLQAPTAALLGSAGEISDAAGRTRTEIARATADLRREGTAIAETSAESRALAAQVAALLGERALELAQAARKVAAETVTMRDANARHQRDLFLSAAKTVLDALGSLAVDISRVLDADLPEELRAELVRGDIPGFVRRLATLRDRVATPKLRAKFATDSRFRTHVQTYLGQFEQLLTQAAAVDQGAVLSATLVSSDIGKIYTFLSAAISTDRDDMQQTA